MRALLFLAAGLLSAGVLYLAWLSLSGVLDGFFYTLLVSAIAIGLIFALFHFIYLYLSARRK